MKTLLSDKDSVGEVFTPLEWADWLLDRWRVFDRWISGASVCDPTAGSGVFALALINKAVNRGITVSSDLLNRLHLVEIKQQRLDTFRENLKMSHSIDYPSSSLHARDVVLSPLRRQFDILLGNPPWSNFTDLPPSYKERLKRCFIEYGLVPDRRAVLLGSARIDLAALVLKVVVFNMLRRDGSGYFFLPLSLFFGDDAHTGFRDYHAKSAPFSIDEVVEFSDEKVFKGIGTAYCAASIQCGEAQKFPVPYFRRRGGSEVKLKACPLYSNSDPWRVSESENIDACYKGINIELSPRQKPRQGINTCGANSVFIFDRFPNFVDAKYIFPLATKETWKGGGAPKKWVFLPYDAETATPLPRQAMQNIGGFAYLQQHKDELQTRKGTLINSAMSGGLWWALLGVGAYSFAPFKVIWQAYGKRDFNPIILGSHNNKPWQANQAMHAFIPCWTKSDAERIYSALKNPHIQRLLIELNGQGQCNFAQPGKIKKILSFGAKNGRQADFFAPERIPGPAP